MLVVPTSSMLCLISSSAKCTIYRIPDFTGVRIPDLVFGPSREWGEEDLPLTVLVSASAMITKTRPRVGTETILSMYWKLMIVKNMSSCNILEPQGSISHLGFRAEMSPVVSAFLATTYCHLIVACEVDTRYLNWIELLSSRSNWFGTLQSVRDEGVRGAVLWPTPVLTTILLTIR